MTCFSLIVVFPSATMPPCMSSNSFNNSVIGLSLQGLSNFSLYTLFYLQVSRDKKINISMVQLSQRKKIFKIITGLCDFNGSQPIHLTISWR